MSSEACCTCAAPLASIIQDNIAETEKSSGCELQLHCCGRTVCRRCIRENERFATYCPFCQISIAPSTLPQGIREPPSYSPPEEESKSEPPTWPSDEEPPPYSAHNPVGPEKASTSKESETAPDVLHFVDPNNDSITSLSLRYGVPIPVLRRINGLYADHLLAARRTVLIPGRYYKGGVSLSPRPLEGEEEETRKGKVRKWMVTCKVAEYDIALLYLQQANYDLDGAIEAYRADESWEAAHPLEASKMGRTASKTTGRRRWGFGGSSGGLTGQLS